MKMFKTNEKTFINILNSLIEKKCRIQYRKDYELRRCCKPTIKLSRMTMIML